MHDRGCTQSGRVDEVVTDGATKVVDNAVKVEPDPPPILPITVGCHHIIASSRTTEVPFIGVPTR